LFAFLGALALGGAGWVGVNRFRARDTRTDVPVAQARSGEFVAIVRCRGELKADRSAQIYAPFMPNLRIAWMAEAGQLVQAGDPVVRFDSSTAQQDLIQKEAALRQAQASLDQAVAQARITFEHDEADLIDAQYQVEIARLKTATNEFISRLEAERNRIDLGVSEQKQKVQQATIDQHKTSDTAKLASLTRQRDQAQAEVDLTRNRLERMEMQAPLSGFWIVASNYTQGTQTGQPFKVGDSVFAGMSLAVIPDMSSLVIDVKVEEIDRGRIAVGNDVRVRVDAVPELVIEGKLTQISPLAEISLEGTVSRNFRGYAALAHPDLRLRPGMNGGMDIVISRLPDAISVPAKAVFTRAGKPVVYVSEQGAFRPVDVEVLARNPDEFAVSGIAPGAVVALAEPDEKADRK
jgi:HlyD family secretion protein